MSEYCVVVAGGTRARIFSLEPAELPDMQSGPNLVERHSIDNPSHSESRRSRNRAVFKLGQGYDEQDKERDRKFARDLAEEVTRLLSRNGYQHLILCADSRMLGMLRPTLSEQIDQSIRVHEVVKDLGKLSCRELHDRLAGDGHLPRRRLRRTG